MDYSFLEEKTGYCFKDKALLETALTHSSYANDYLGNSALGNERLEFLGDAVLDAAVGYKLYVMYPDADEGLLTRLRAEIVCESSLGEAAKRIGLGDYMRLGKGESRKEGARKLSMLADAVEAVIAAVFLDGGPEAAMTAAWTILDSTIKAAAEGSLDKDYKSELQMLCQKVGKTDISYRIIGESGPDHLKTFTAEVLVCGQALGTGSGGSKKQAQAQAAKTALESLGGKLAF